MNKTTVWSIIISLTLILGLAGAIALVRTSQDYRSSAAFATGSISLLPSPMGTVNVGSENKVHISVNGADKKVNGVQTVVCYGPELEVDASTVTPGSDFDIILSKNTQVGDKNCVDLTIGAKTNVTLSAGVADVAVITFKAVNVGSGQVEILQDKIIVSGENPGSTDNLISMGSVSNTNYTVSDSGLSSGSASISPSAMGGINIGSEKTVAISVNAGDEKVNGVQAVVCYGPELEIDNVNEKVLPTAKFDMILIKEIESNGKKCVDLTLGGKTNVTLTSGNVDVANITFKAINEGSGTVEILKDRLVVSGENPGSNVNQIAITDVNDASYSVISSTTKLLNFKVSFQGVTPASACANDMPVSVIVMSAGETHVYTDVPLTKTNQTNKSGLSVYLGSVPLIGVQLPANDVAVFIKGPKHLQMKYGIDWQTDFYNKSGGEVMVNADVNEGKIYNFQNYPIMAGDVVGENNSNQDGVVDGIDFNYVKSSAISRDTVSSGEYLSTDLDGSCQVNSADVTTLMLSLKEKQAQLY